jgi:hypothetical protein
MNLYIYTIRNVIPAAQGRAEINVAGEDKMNLYIYTIRNVIPAAQGRAEINVAGEDVSIIR